MCESCAPPYTLCSGQHAVARAAKMLSVSMLQGTRFQ
jgi:hypothetical protein